MRTLFTKMVKATFFVFVLLAFIGAHATPSPIGTFSTSINLDPQDLPTAYNVTGDSSYYCDGDGGLPVGLSNSETGVTYTLYLDDVTTGQTVAGTGSPITFGNQVVPDFNTYHSFTVKGTNTDGTTDMNDTVWIAALEKITPSVIIFPDATLVLAGISVTFQAVAEYGENPTYQWYKNGLPVGDNDYIYTYAPANNDQVYVEMTDSWPCVTTPSQTVLSNTVTMVVVDNFWTGSAGNFWNNPANWNPMTVPSSTADVYIPTVNPHNLVIPTATSCHNLIVKSGSSLTIGNTGSLTLSGTLTLNGQNGLFIESDAGGTGSLIDNGIAGTGTASVQRYLAADAWHYLSSPINSATANVFLGDYLRTSDPTSTTGWGDYITALSTPLAVMRGYACWKPSGNSTSEVFIGKLNTGTKTFTGNRTATDPFAGWHLVGNPYPSSIDLASGSITWDQFEPAAYFWDEYGSGNPLYTSGNYNVALASPANFGTHSQYAPPGQGFFVHINDSYVGNSTLTFTNAARVHSSEPFLKDAPVIQNALLMVASGSANTYSDKATVHFKPDATSGYDPGYDAYKLRGLSEAPQLYTRIGNTNVTCNSLPFEQKNMVVPMGFSCGLPGMFTLTADSLRTFVNAISITLEDLKLNLTQDMRINPVYTFSYDTIDNPNRFVLHFYNPSFGVNDSENIQPVQIYSFENAVYIKSQNGNLREGIVTIYNLIGKELFHEMLTDQSLNRINSDVVEGYYLVRVMTNLGVYNTKVYLKNQ